MVGGVVPAGAVGRVRGRAGAARGGGLAGRREAAGGIGSVRLEQVSTAAAQALQMKRRRTVRSTTADWRLGVAAAGAAGWLSVIQVTRIFFS